MPTSDEQITTQAADLAEWIVDEISESDQDWRAVELRTRELLELVRRRAATQSVDARPISTTRTAQDIHCEDGRDHARRS